MVVRVKSNNNEIAVIVRDSFTRKGTEFFTNDDAPQQLGYIQHDAGYVIEPHVHNSFKREIFSTVEVLLIKSVCAKGTKVHYRSLERRARIGTLEGIALTRCHHLSQRSGTEAALE